MNEINQIQYYLKCQNVETGEVITYRFGNEADLISFSQHFFEYNLSIIDSHIVFYDAPLLFNQFDDESKIGSGDINTAQDGRVQVENWLKKD